MLRRQIALRLECDRLLRAHHDRVNEPAQQHDRGQRHIHDADVLMVDAGDPFAPQIRDPALDRDESEHAENHDDDEGAREQRNGLVERNGAPAQLAEHLVPLPHTGARIGLGDWPGTWRQRLIENLLEQSVGDRAEGERRRHHALFGKLDIAFRREFISRRRASGPASRKTPASSSPRPRNACWQIRRRLSELQDRERSPGHRPRD